MKNGNGAILIVDDNPTEQLLIKEAFQELQVKDAIYTVNDGEEAIAFLKRTGPFADRQKFRFPTFLLIDLKMPKVNGFELLLFVKRSKLIVIPTIVLTSSADQDDVQRSYLLGANAFHTKPTKLEGLLLVLKGIYEYWGFVQLPDVDESGNVRLAENRGKLGEKFPPVIGN